MRPNTDQRLFELGQIFGSPGGKTVLADRIAELLPRHKTYIECFSGGASVFFRKPPSKVEVLNDIDPEIAHAYRFVQNITDEKIQTLKRKKWEPDAKFFKKLKNSKPVDEVERFHRFYYILRYSYGSSRESFSNLRPVKIDANKFLTYKERLKGVKIYNKDYKEIIKKYDSRDSVIYLDPPYPEDWPYTTTKAFTKEDMQEMHDLLKKVKSKFILSINVLPWIKEMFSDFIIKKIKTKRKIINVKTGGSVGSRYEFLIMNFDPEKTIKGELHDLDEIKGHLTKQEYASFPDEITLIERYVSIGGSSVDRQDKKPDDIDLIIRLGEPNNLRDFLKRNTISEIKKSNPRAHPFPEVHGPAGYRMPLYDLKMIKRPWDEVNVEMSEEKISLPDYKCEPMKPFTPMKPRKRFYRINEIVDYMFNK